MKPKTFKRALFGGFDRADVMNYIAEEHARFLSEKKELSDRLEQIGTQLTAVQQELDTLQQQKEAVQQELAAVSAERDEMQHELQTQAGRILTQARINAQSVVHDARIKADAMQQQSERLLQNARGGLDTTRESLAGARDALRELLDETLERIEGICEDLAREPELPELPQTQKKNARVHKIPVRINRHVTISKVK